MYVLCRRRLAFFALGCDASSVTPLLWLDKEEGGRKEKGRPRWTNAQTQRSHSAVTGPWLGFVEKESDLEESPGTPSRAVIIETEPRCGQTTDEAGVVQ